MNLSCPICGNYILSYKEKMTLAPLPNQFSLPTVKCKSCGELLCSTFLSRLILVSLTFGVILKIGFYFDDPKLSGFQFSVMFLSVGSLFYFGIWQFIVRLKKWRPPEEYLPKSRLVGYSLYLILPITLMITLLYLAIRFEWGI